MLDIRVAVAKINAVSSDESGDTVEIIERPNGGFSFVLVDGQGSGRGAKSLSNLLTARAITLLKDGARDDSVAMAVHDYLYTYRMGQNAATLNILSVDFATRTISMVRNNPAPFFVLTPDGTQHYADEVHPIGLYAQTRPEVTRLPLQPYTYVMMFTDGLLRAGERSQQNLDLPNYLAGWSVHTAHPPEVLTEVLLERALVLDAYAPSDDSSIVTLAVLPVEPATTTPPAYPVRRLTMTVLFDDEAHPSLIR